MEVVTFAFYPLWSPVIKTHGIGCRFQLMKDDISDNYYLSKHRRSMILWTVFAQEENPEWRRGSSKCKKGGGSAAPKKMLLSGVLEMPISAIFEGRCSN